MKTKRNISGVLLLDKPAGLSSNQVLQAVKRLFAAAKAGHTGTLDPMATGLLPVCLGEATKFSGVLLGADKTYEAVLKLGLVTSTGDTEGEILSRREVRVEKSDVIEVLDHLTGPVMQLPPMYSALKYKGKPLYEYARKGEQVERKPRPVTIFLLRLDAMEGDEVTITVRCSKGTYVRTLAEDIGTVLGCGAHLAALRRTAIGHLDLSRAVTPKQLEMMTMPERDEILGPVDRLLQQYPPLVLESEQACALRRGQQVTGPEPNETGPVRLYDAQNRFLGMGEVTEGGSIVPRRLVAG